MSNAWNRAAGMADKHANSGGIFIRLANDGDKVVGAFCGEPFPREVIWNGERYDMFDPEVHAGKKPSLRVMLNFFVPAEGATKVIEGGTVWFKDVLKVRDKYGLDKWLFEIERHGAAGDPKTNYTILPEEKIDSAMRALIDSAGLHDLAAIGSGDSGDGDPPIDSETVAELVTRLKALPRPDVDAFLGQFRVQRVRDLRMSDVEAARQLLGGLEARARRRAEPQPTELDPFA
jgi:hypothetical protein